MNKNIKTKYKMRVPFYDIDPMNIVWHGNYLKYLEEARCDFFRKIKYTYEEMQEEGIVYPIAKLEMKFNKSAYFGEELEIELTLVEVEPAIIFKYIIFDYATREVICKAKTMQIGVNAKTKETVLKINENFERKLNEYKI